MLVIMYDEYEYEQFIRKFPTYNVLEYFSMQSLDIYKNMSNGIKFEDVSWYIRNKRNQVKIETHTFDVAQWDLLNVCFNSIKFGNDYRNKKVTKKDYYMLINKTSKRNEILENAENFNDGDLKKHLLCVANMEFDFEIPNIKNRFNRLYHMMTVINQNKKYDQTSKVNYIDFKTKFFEITGIEYEVYVNCYMFICLLSISRKSVNIMDIIKEIKFDISKLGFTKEDIFKIISFQSKDYSFYRKFDNWNILKYNPIVHSDKYKSKYIISNISALLISFSEFMYWIIRNYYCELKKQDFTNYFGYCFEFYLSELFETYGIKADKIEETSDCKLPDWKLETDSYIFLIEQKSALFPIDTRSTTSGKRFKILDKYLKDNISNAFIQLNSYDFNSNKPIIRICLTFERIYFVEIVQDIIFPKINLIKNEYLNWIVPIDDFEKLIYILFTNKENFNSIISQKINLEKRKAQDGRGFDTLLDKYSNDYTDNKINHFDAIINKDLELLKQMRNNS